MPWFHSSMSVFSSDFKLFDSPFNFSWGLTAPSNRVTGELSQMLRIVDLICHRHYEQKSVQLCESLVTLLRHVGNCFVEKVSIYHPKPWSCFKCLLFWKLSSLVPNFALIIWPLERVYLCITSSWTMESQIVWFANISLPLELSQVQFFAPHLLLVLSLSFWRHSDFWIRTNVPSLWIPQIIPKQHVY